MEVTIRTIGNSKGVVLPKPLLAQVGLEGELCADIKIEGDAIVLRRTSRGARTGWADAAKALSAQGNDALVMGEFGNADDTDLAW